MIFSTVRAPQLPPYGRVVGHHRHPAPSIMPSPVTNRPRQLVGEHDGEEAVLDEGNPCRAQIEALANRQLVLLAELGR